MTLKQLIEMAMIDVGFLPEGEEASPTSIINGLSLLNSMLGAWSNDGLVVPVIDRDTFDLLEKQEITIGPGCDLSMAAFITVVDLTIIDDSGAKTQPFSVDESYVASKRAGEGIVPTVYAFEASYPAGRIIFNTVPPAGCSLTVRTTRPFNELSEMTGEIELPPGYELTMQSGLTILMASKYGKGVNPAVAATFQSTYDGLLRTNAVNRGVSILKVDIPYSKRGDHHNIYG